MLPQDSETSHPAVSMNSPHSRPIRVLHVIQNLNYGGMERLIAEMVRRLPRDRFDLHVVGLQFLGRFAEGLESFATCHVGPSMTKASMFRPKSLSLFIKRIDPDVVHSHSGVWHKAAVAAAMASVPRVVHTDHGRTFPMSFATRLQDRIALARTDALVAVSADLADNLRAVSPRYAARLVVVENGVDVERFRPRPANGELRSELGIGDETPLVLSVGRLEWVKGFDIALQAVRKLHDLWPGSQPPALVVAGDGQQAPGLRSQARALGIAASCFFLSWRDDIDHLHRSTSLFTMSSRSEGTSVSLLEAMSAGLCPVVTDVGGNRAVLGPNLTHRLVPPEDPEALAAAWLDALLEPEKAASDGRLARERVVAAFSLERTVQLYERLYTGELFEEAAQPSEGSPS